MGHMSGDRRWPSSVYGVGRDPDPRFSLANERTFLAWIRTALGFLAGAAAAEALDLPMPDLAQEVLAVMLALGSAMAAVQAWTGWVRAERALRSGDPLPPAVLTLPIAVVLLALALGLGATALLT